ncbi:MAG: hypothetical protein ACRELD_05895 [Longimicrobiales bacterium]
MSATSPEPEAARARRFRQAAIVYLHVGVLYEAAVFALWRAGDLPLERGPPWLWLLLGAVITVVISGALWRWHRPWLAWGVWAVHALRLPALIGGAFLEPTGPAGALPPSFYLTALVVVVINLGFLARAGWNV